MKKVFSSIDRSIDRAIKPQLASDRSKKEKDAV